MAERQPITIGQRFNRLEIIAKLGVRNKNRLWLCRCNCGTVKEVRGDHLRSGSTESCGCFRNDKLRQQSLRHGLENVPEFRIWRWMIRRCHNPKANRFAYYGSRGIKVCDRWRESFHAFFEDMGPRPTPKHSLDRIDNDGNYEPGNVRWGTRLEQARNARVNVRLVTVEGETKPLWAWAEIAGINPSTIRTRLRKGWSAKEAVFTKSRNCRVPAERIREVKRLCSEGLSLAETARRLGMPKATVRNVLHKHA